jgi:N-dimethylarginine dimethylaminohydrolase
MSITVEDDRQTLEEAKAILMERMPAHKVARIFASLQLGSGDYLSTREQLLAGKSVKDLYEMAKRFEKAPL